ncbi:hypothetical protein B0H11DRAFT_1867737 [Mycena galericulata]|nr:hypothetical protein B0H11DRAFT_1867737 [Mycena galericulata]
MSCLSHCPKHCAANEDDMPGLLQSPFPETLSSNTIPSDPQVCAIHDAIQRAEAAISEKTGMIQRLEQQRADLEAFVNKQRGVVSAMRRFPNEILGDIFGHFVYHQEFNPSKNMPWRIARVCSRWRSVALAFPRLWTHFCFGGPRHSDPRMVLLQLQRSSHMPLTVKTRDVHLGLLDVLMTASTRWQSVDLSFSASGSNVKIFESLCAGNFPALQKLTVHMERGSSSQIVAFIQALPALVTLALDPGTAALSNYFSISWSRLQECTLTRCRMVDVLRILSFLSLGTRVHITNASKGRKPEDLPPTSSSILAIAFEDCRPTSVHQLLGAITAPALEELHFGENIYRKENNNMVEQIIAFLARSACPLTRLHTGAHLAQYEILRILQSPSTSSLVAVAVTCTSFDFGIVALASPTLVPQLRELSLKCGPPSESIEAKLLEMVVARRPVLQLLRLETTTRHGDWTLSQDAMRTLRESGVRTMLLSSGNGD